MWYHQSYGIMVRRELYGATKGVFFQPHDAIFFGMCHMESTVWIKIMVVHGKCCCPISAMLLNCWTYFGYS